MTRRLLFAAVAAILLSSFAHAGVAGEQTEGLILKSEFEQVTVQEVSTEVRNVVVEQLTQIFAEGSVVFPPRTLDRISREIVVSGPETAAALTEARSQLRSDLIAIAGRRGQFTQDSTSFLGSNSVVVSQDFESRNDGQAVSGQVSTDVSVAPDAVFIGDLDDLAKIIVVSGTVTITATFTEITTQFITEITTNNLSQTDSYQIVQTYDISPLVLDLDGDGSIEASGGEWRPHTTLRRDRMAFFDMRGNGFPMLTEWVGPNDGLLCQPKANGTIDGSCLFGTVTGFDDGFQALSVLDVNNDKKVSGDELATLKVWTDSNGNAYPEDGEVRSVSDYGITAIGVRHKDFVSQFMMDGNTYKIFDWWPSAAELNKFNLQKYQQASR